MNFSLNRYDLIGEIDYNTPLCVIEEIMMCLGADINVEDIVTNREKVIDFIVSEKRYIVLKSDYSDEELEAISLFVSQKDTSWTKENLIKAFNHIVEFDNTIEQDLFIYGPKSEERPLSYDATMLYTYCVSKGIHTNSTDKINDLAVYVRLSFAKRHVLLQSIIGKLVSVDNCGLINALKEIKDSKYKEFVFTDSTTETINKLRNLDKPLSKAVLTNEEALVYAAKTYFIDFSESTNPSRELIEFAKGTYKPYTQDKFSENYKKNPLFYRMDVFWKRHLASLYTERILYSLLDNECVKRSEISDPKQFLYEITLTKNFYPGVIPNASYTDTFVYKTPFDELNTKHVISYGILDTFDLVALTPEEIISFLKTHREFRDFKNEGEVLSERNVKKLVELCKNFPQEESFVTLLKTIKETKEVGNVMNSKIKEFIMYVNKCDTSIKNKIDELFDKLFLLSMYMRGWNGESEYPLSERDCENYTERYDVIEENVNTNLRDVMERINALPDTSKMLIKSLPLIKLSDKDKSLYRSTNTDEGLTFFERLNILADNKSQNIYACLRLSSNHIAATAQHYNVLLNSKQYIDLNRLDIIT